MKSWSSEWKASTKPKKQRLYVRNAPVHVLNNFIGSHLSKDLREILGKRSISVRKGDKVKVMRGQFKGKTGTVERVEPKAQKVYVTGVELSKKDGSKAFYPVKPSNLVVMELEGKDKRRTGGKK